MAENKKFAGEEVRREYEFSVECPHPTCKAKPGFFCRKPNGTRYYGTHMARRERARAQAEA